MVEMIARLYKIEKEHRLLDIEERHRARQETSKPILDEIRLWLDVNIPRTPPKGALGEAMAYMDKYWPRLIRYCERSDREAYPKGRQSSFYTAQKIATPKERVQAPSQNDGLQ